MACVLRSAAIEGTIALLLIVPVLDPAPASSNLLINGGFEDGDGIAFSGGFFETLAAGSTVLPGWLVTRDTVDYDSAARYTNGDDLAGSGDRSIDLDGTPGPLTRCLPHAGRSCQKFSYRPPESLLVRLMRFVDGGVSPFNNPSLQAFMYATLDGYLVGCPSGAEKLLLVSVGTGARDPSLKPMSITAGHAIQSLTSLMDDCAALVETMLQWMSASPTARSHRRGQDHVPHGHG